MEPKENSSCYETPEQRQVLQHLISLSVISDSFFLTGGTALSAFYLHHRKSNDLDFFSIDPQDLTQIDFQIKRIWPNDILPINMSPHSMSFLFKNVKVDVIIDPVSKREQRPMIQLGRKGMLRIDTMTNIVSNKFCTLVSRTEPKDYVDFFFISKMFPDFDKNTAFNDAATKDGIFDDPPTVAFQIEAGLEFMKRNSDLFPDIIVEFNQELFFLFYHNLVKWIYDKAAPDQ